MANEKIKKLLTFLEELYKIKTIEGKKEKSEVIQMTKKLKTLGAVYIYIYIYIVIFKNINSKLNRGNKAKLIAVFGGRL